MRSQVETAKSDAKALADALAATPTTADPQLAATKQPLDQDQKALEASIDGLRTAITQLVNAQNAASRSAALATAKTQLAQTRAAASTFVSGVKTAATQGSAAARAAFQSAPSCSAILQRASSRATSSS